MTIFIAVILCSIVQMAKIPCTRGMEGSTGLAMSKERNSKDSRLDYTDIASIRVAVNVQRPAHRNPINGAPVRCDGRVQIVAHLVPDGINGLTATWIVSDPCDEVVEYKVFFRQDLGPIIFTGNTNDTTMTFDDLPACVTHTLEVYALDSKSQIIGQKGHSSVYSVKPEVQIIAHLVPGGDNVLMATWIVSDPCDEVVEYKVFFRQDLGPIIFTGNTNDTTMTFEDLPACVTHTLEVYALDSKSQIIGQKGHSSVYSVKPEVQIIAHLVPGGDNVLMATWIVSDPCDQVVEYKVFFRQDLGPILFSGNTNDTTMTFGDLQGCVTHTLEVYALDSNSQIIGREGHSMAYTEIQGPGIANLTYNADLKNITVNWSPNDPSCFPGVRYRVTTNGVDDIVTDNHYVIRELDCDSSYEVSVVPIDVDGNNYGVPASSIMNTTRENTTLRVTAISLTARSLAAGWDPIVSSCENITGYGVKDSETGGATWGHLHTTTKTYFHYSSMDPGKVIDVLVQPLNGNGLPFGDGGGDVTQIAPMTYWPLCRFPSQQLQVMETIMICGQVIFPAVNTLEEANAACSVHEFENQVNPGYLFSQYPRFLAFDTLRGLLKYSFYTEQLMVSAEYNNGWFWKNMRDPDSPTPVDPALLTGVPEGGNSPDDYKMLFMDPARDFQLNAAKDGHEFGGIFCIFTVPRSLG